MSNSVQPHRRQTTKVRRPWDSPGKNTGVGCHFLLQCRNVKSESEVAQLCPTLRDPMDCSPLGSSVHGIFQARVLEWGAIAFSRCFKCAIPNSHNFVKKEFYSILQIRILRFKSRRHNPPRLHTILQSCNNQNSMILAQK